MCGNPGLADSGGPGWGLGRVRLRGAAAGRRPVLRQPLPGGDPDCLLAKHCLCPARRPQNHCSSSSKHCPLSRQGQKQEMMPRHLLLHSPTRVARAARAARRYVSQTDPGRAAGGGSTCGQGLPCSVRGEGGANSACKCPWGLQGGLPRGERLGLSGGRGVTELKRQ